MDNSRSGNDSNIDLTPKEPFKKTNIPRKATFATLTKLKAIEL